MYLSEQIAKMIEELLNDNSGTAELQRNDLATRLGCVPSQINYVITSRFTPEKGYIVESRRGGGGYIRIKRIRFDGASYMMHFINAISDSLDYPTCKAFINNLLGEDLVTKREAAIIKLMLSERALCDVPPEMKNKLRASILKNAVIAIVNSR